MDRSGHKCFAISNASWPALVLLGLLCASAFVQNAAAQAEPPLRVAIVGLVHGHVEGFLGQLPKHPEVQLVGIAEPDAALQAKYREKYALPEELFFRDTARMIETRRPQAVLVYTSIAGHRRVIETAAQYGVSVMVEKPLTHLARRCAGNPEDGARTPHSCAGELRDDLVREQPRRL